MTGVDPRILDLCSLEHSSLASLRISTEEMSDCNDIIGQRDYYKGNKACFRYYYRPDKLIRPIVYHKVSWH